VIDRRPEKVASHVMDLEQVLALGGGPAVSAGSWDELEGVDALVVCASTALTANTSRAVYLQDNSAIVDGIAARLAGWHGVVVMVTNPVDPLTARLARALGDRRRVVGYTLNDSLRLRTSIAASLGVAPAAVEAWVLGEHGDRAVPVFSRVRVDGAPVILHAPARGGRRLRAQLVPATCRARRGAFLDLDEWRRRSADGRGDRDRLGGAVGGVNAA